MTVKIRKRILPAGWYPDTPAEIRKIFKKWESEKKNSNEALSAIVPHAGWFYSGQIAFNAISCLKSNSQTIVIAGGHLSENDPVLSAREDKFDAVTGVIENDMELLNYLSEFHNFYEDDYPDNTVEVNLPMISYLFPESRILWLRIPPDYEKIRSIAEHIYNYSKNTSRTITVIGSTDLTHYGYNYGYHPHGEGMEGLNWVKDVNDKEFIDLITDYQIKKAIDHSKKNLSACSSGGASLAAEYAMLNKCRKGELISYQTSYDISPSDSFVGYAGIIFHQ